MQPGKRQRTGRNRIAVRQQPVSGQIVSLPRQYRADQTELRIGQRRLIAPMYQQRRTGRLQNLLHGENMIKMHMGEQNITHRHVFRGDRAQDTFGFRARIHHHAAARRIVSVQNIAIGLQTADRQL